MMTIEGWEPKPAKPPLLCRIGLHRAEQIACQGGGLGAIVTFRCLRCDVVYDDVVTG